MVVSVEYRLAPEHPIPAAYDDAWTTLQWVASLADPWLADHADPSRTFLAGDSAGGNIVYHTAVRASRDRRCVGIEIEGVVMVHPFFWGSERLPSETVCDGLSMFPAHRVDLLWPFVTAGQAGNDDPRPAETAGPGDLVAHLPACSGGRRREGYAARPRVSLAGPHPRLWRRRPSDDDDDAGGVGGRGPLLPPQPPAACDQ